MAPLRLKKIFPTRLFFAFIKIFETTKCWNDFCYLNKTPVDHLHSFRPESLQRQHILASQAQPEDANLEENIFIQVSK